MTAPTRGEVSSTAYPGEAPEEIRRPRARGRGERERVSGGRGAPEVQRGGRSVKENARVTGLDAGVGGAGRQFDASLSFNPGKGQEEAGDAVGVVMMRIRRFGFGHLRESRVDSGPGISDPGISAPEIGAVLDEGRGFEPGKPRVEMPRVEIP